MLSADSLAIITRVITRSHNQDHYVVKSCRMVKVVVSKVDCRVVNSPVDRMGQTKGEEKETKKRNEGTIGSNPFLQ